MAQLQLFNRVGWKEARQERKQKLWVDYGLIQRPTPHVQLDTIVHDPLEDKRTPAKSRLIAAIQKARAGYQSGA